MKVKGADGYRILRGDSLDVCISDEGAYHVGLDAIKPKYTAGRAWQLAEARVAEAKAFGRIDGPLNSSRAWVAEGVIYVPEDDTVLFVPKELNPVLRYAKQAVRAHRREKEFTITDEYLEYIIGDKTVRNMSLQDADKLALGISTQAFGDDPVTDLFGWGKDYGQFLSDCGIEVVPLSLTGSDYVKRQKQAFSRGLWVFSLLYSYSAISGNGNLYSPFGRVFGVRERSTPRRAEIFTGNAGLDARIADAIAHKTSFNLDNDWIYVPVRKDAITR